MKVWGHITNCLKTGGSCALVTVTRVDGSTPREAGARMVVRQDGAFYGTIGGGTLEFEAIRMAVEAVRKERESFVLHTVSLGPDLGQCCGGRASVSMEVLTRNSLETAMKLAEAEANQSSFGTCAEISGGSLGPRRLLETVPDSPFAISEEKAGTATLCERFGNEKRHLMLFGAGHVGKALVLALAPLPFEITWVDSRPDQFPGPVPLNVTKVCVDKPAAMLDEAPDGAFVVVITHSHALDEEIMARALLNQSFGYCGVIGSKTKRARFLRRLKARGIDNALLAHMICPIGASAVKSKHPAAIAAGIAVEMLAHDEALLQRSSADAGLAQKITHGQ
ncbi:xanthine dehydrogenase accessory protein XdhC [uncultured Roseibium sp.]|uniref:xanthine dehydrogenase accessory protein XdhC n=1 Tax=uncultured Roseibium sp. TaxID=1936171 RepID=UPI002638C7D5|nr:xanthine dehydrogenase accessory protein XdhC [uncultured Roseibium sp.]